MMINHYFVHYSWIISCKRSFYPMKSQARLSMDQREIYSWTDECGQRGSETPNFMRNILHDIMVDILKFC